MFLLIFMLVLQLILICCQGYNSYICLRFSSNIYIYFYFSFVSINKKYCIVNNKNTFFKHIYDYKF